MRGASGKLPGPCDEALLNAYVDGELGAAEAAALAQRAACEPAMAGRIAALHQMKAALAMLGSEASPPPLPPPLPPPPLGATAPRCRRGRLIAAGALALVAAVAALMAVMIMPLAGPPVAAPSGTPAQQVRAGDAETRDTVGDSALARHDAWVAGYDPEAETLPAPAWLEAPMQAAGLRLVYLAPIASGSGRDKLHHGFTGTRDCRLSLFEKETPQSGLGALRLSLETALLRAEWQVQGRRYTMLARDMNRERFTAIATALHDVSDARAPAGAMLLAGLEASRLPCTA